MRYFAIPSYFLVALIAWAVTGTLTPYVRRIAHWARAIDFPGGRRIHHHPKPRLGGLAIYTGFLFALLVAIPMSRTIEVLRTANQIVIRIPLVPESDRAMVGILLGGTLITLLGAIDDIRGMHPGVKFLGQVACAAVLIPFGLSTLFLTNPLSGMMYIGRWGALVTILWVVATTNIINFIDGVDGLAAGISAIAGVVLFLTASQRQDLAAMAMTAALVGSSLGFLRYNFNPARIFMGDSGSMFLGYVLGAVSVMGLYKSVTAISLLVPLLALGVPIFDTAFAIVRRLRAGYPIYLPDRGHIHHRLLDRGLTQRQTVLLLYLLSAFLGIGALALAGINRIPALITLGAIAVVLIVGAKRMGLLQFP
jgi:UDP-GlcNAc:undecaprenyl-phosphate GlcNAc-1-phosphate transferase